MGRLYKTWIVEHAGLHVEEIRMFRRGRKEGRAAIWAEMAGELPTTLAVFREFPWSPRREPELRAEKADTDIEGAAGAPTAVLAVAIVRRPDYPAVLEYDATTETASRNDARHRILLSVLAYEIRHAAQRMAAKLRPRVMLPRFLPSTACRVTEARGRQLHSLLGGVGSVCATARSDERWRPAAAQEWLLEAVVG